MMSVLRRRRRRRRPLGQFIVTSLLPCSRTRTGPDDRVALGAACMLLEKAGATPQERRRRVRVAVPFVLRMWMGAIIADLRAVDR